MSNKLQNYIIDVGSNYGEFALEIAQRNPDVQVIAIEPNINLTNHINNLCKTKQIQNIELFNCAINNIEQTSCFHISDHNDSGISSLLSFEKNKILVDPYWSNRKDLNFDRTIKVQVKRLDTLLNDKKLDRIRFIKIDAQGVDLNVLESLGNLLDKTDAGMLEAPGTLENNLYEGETADLQKTLNSITNLGFKIYNLKPNDHAANEFNVFFCKPDICWKSLENELGLRNINLYDGKNFWHYPSNKWEPIEATILELNKSIEALNLTSQKQKTIIEEQKSIIEELENDSRYLHSLFCVRIRKSLKKILHG